MSTDLEPPRGSKFSAAVYDPMLWWAERSGMAARRRRLLAKARGSVLELGAGTGLNLPLYPTEGIERLVVTEPEPNMANRLERRSVTQQGVALVCRRHQCLAPRTALRTGAERQSDGDCA